MFEGGGEVRRLLDRLEAGLQSLSHLRRQSLIGEWLWLWHCLLSCCWLFSARAVGYRARRRPCLRRGSSRLAFGLLRPSVHDGAIPPRCFEPSQSSTSTTRHAQVVGLIQIGAGNVGSFRRHLSSVHGETPSCSARSRLRIIRNVGGGGATSSGAVALSSALVLARLARGRTRGMAHLPQEPCGCWR